jgi:DNA-directed RNA polymerase sigma subunit (sigma70/sigma32)
LSTTARYRLPWITTACSAPRCHPRRRGSQKELQESPEELAEILDLPKEKVSDTLRVSGRHVSVDAPFIEGEDNSLLDVLTNSDSPVADKLLMDESLSREIYRALATLTERERDIIRFFLWHWLPGNDTRRDRREVWPDQGKSKAN